MAVLAAARTIPFGPRDWLTLGWLAFSDRNLQEEGRFPMLPNGSQHTFEVTPVGYVVSQLVDRATTPKQGFEGAPEAWLVFNPDVVEAVDDLTAGSDVFVLTWLHKAHRDVLAVHPRDDPRNPLTGVFSTRSQDRPNPIGLHRVQIVAIEGHRVLVRNLEAFDGTPIVDVKPVLEGGR